jgi:hypothetical protein
LTIRELEAERIKAQASPATFYRVPKNAEALRALAVKHKAVGSDPVALVNELLLMHAGDTLSGLNSAQAETKAASLASHDVRQLRKAELARRDAFDSEWQAAITDRDRRIAEEAKRRAYQGSSVRVPPTDAGKEPSFVKFMARWTGLAGDYGLYPRGMVAPSAGDVRQAIELRVAALTRVLVSRDQVEAAPAGLAKLRADAEKARKRAVAASLAEEEARRACRHDRSQAAELASRQASEALAAVQRELDEMAAQAWRDYGVAA